MSTSSQPAILVLGGTGTVGSRIVSQLAASSHPHRILVASRNGSKNNESNPNTNPKVQHVPFNWHDTDTWDNLFPATAGKTDITAVYLIAPPTLGAEQTMIDFVELARGRGVRRFVLQSGSPIEAGGPAMGKVHEHLRELGQRGEVEWACLRPTWFQRM
jgi:festuclavine dehydrogenase